MKPPKTAYEQFMEMSEAQRNAATSEYDREMPGTPGEALSASGKAEHAKARRRARAGRPRVGHGAKRVLVTVERGLLKRADAYARAHGLNRSELIARALTSIVNSAA